MIYPQDLHAGSVLTSDVKANKVPIDMDTELDWRFKDAYFFEALLREIQGGRTSKRNMKTEWMDVHPLANIVIVTADSSATSLSVDFPSRCHRDDLLYNVTKNQFCLVQEDVGGTASAGTVSVVNIAGTGNLNSGNTTTWETGDIVRILGEAHAEGEAIPPAFSDKPVPKWVYLMQRDRTSKYSDLAQQHDEYGERQFLIDRRQAWIQYKSQWVLLMYFGQKNREVVSGDGRRHVMSGMKEQIETNIVDFSSAPGGMTLTALGEVLRRTKYTSSASANRLAMIGTNASMQISAMPATAVRTSPGAPMWGDYVKEILTPHGKLMFRYDPELSAENGAADVMMVFDPAHVHMLKFGTLDDTMLLDRGGPLDIHNTTDVLTGTCGLQLRQEQNAAWCHGI